ncbi:sugar transferase [Carnobacterium maltaromaticum]|uniref:sugar transferase n=1 Tax=Carnobacterium maltaromaticum TaxID=2751 RepID=UPI00026C8CF6|nr:sugar transferase [Carnobacterium maltaromaticum]
MYTKYLKRLIDFMLALMGIIILLAVMLFIILLIKLDSRGPVLFKQKRVGKNKNYFYIYKFRTMRVDSPTEMPTHLLENPDLFITKIGKILRKTSLDEIPQIFNILKGEMSLIGPRPALWNQYDLIKERDKYSVNALLPGITGLAQINGRDELSIEEKARIDGRYANEMSFFLDTKIFFLTFLSIIKLDGVKEGKNS